MIIERDLVYFKFIKLIYLFVPYISEYVVSVPTEGPNAGCHVQHYITKIIVLFRNIS